MVGTPKKPAGRSVTVHGPKQNIKKELDAMKQELLAELAKILGQVQAAQLLGIQQSAPQEEEEELMFIPSTICTGDVEAEITIQSEESDSDSLDSAAEALKAMKRNKEENNE